MTDEQRRPSTALRSLLDEAANGPWTPEGQIDYDKDANVVWLTNAGQDSLWLDASDVALLLNVLLDDADRARLEAALRTIRDRHFAVETQAIDEDGAGDPATLCGVHPWPVAWPCEDYTLARAALGEQEPTGVSASDIAAAVRPGIEAAQDFEDTLRRINDTVTGASGET